MKRRKEKENHRSRLREVEQLQSIINLSGYIFCINFASQIALIGIVLSIKQCCLTKHSFDESNVFVETKRQDQSEDENITKTRSKC